MAPDLTLRAVRPADARALADLYAPYVHDSIVTFEEVAPSPEEMARRIEATTKTHPWLVACLDEPVAYACATPWKARSAYRYTAEGTIYVAREQVGQGIGRRLYQALLDELHRRGLHTVLGGIALPNDASVALHEKLGFHQVAHFERVGWKLGRWVDVGYWQRSLPSSNLLP